MTFLPVVHSEPTCRHDRTSCHATVPNPIPRGNKWTSASRATPPLPLFHRLSLSSSQQPNDLCDFQITGERETDKQITITQIGRIKISQTNPHKTTQYVIGLPVDRYAFQLRYGSSRNRMRTINLFPWSSENMKLYSYSILAYVGEIFKNLRVNLMCIAVSNGWIKLSSYQSVSFFIAF